MLNRKQFVITALGSVALRHARAESEFDEDPLPPLPGSIDSYRDECDCFSTQLEQQQLGKEDPGKASREFALEILNKAPKVSRRGWTTFLD